MRIGTPIFGQDIQAGKGREKFKQEKVGIENAAAHGREKRAGSVTAWCPG